MNQQLDERGGSVLRAEIEKLGVGVYTSKRTTAVLRDEAGRSPGSAFVDGTTRADMVVVDGRNPAQHRTRAGRRAGGRTRHRGRRPDALRGRGCRVRGRRVRTAPRRDLRLVAPVWEQSVILADVLTGSNPKRRTSARATTKLKVAGVDVAAMGVKGPEHEDDEFVQFYEPRSGTYKSLVVRDDKLIGATLMGDISKAGFLTQAFDDKVPLPEERISMLFDVGPPSAADRVSPISPTTSRCATATASARAIVGVRPRRLPRPSPRSAPRPGPARAAARARDSSPTSWPAPRAANSSRPLGRLVRALHPDDQARTHRAIGNAISVRCPRCSPSSPRTGKEDATAKMPLASLLRIIWGPDWVDETRRAVHQRPRPRQHPARRHVLGGPADGRVA